MELNEIRQEIDAINRQMQSLFERRMELCGKVAEYKGAHSMKIFVPEREEAILSTVREQASPAFAEYDVEFFRCRSFPPRQNRLPPLPAGHHQNRY